MSCSEELIVRKTCRVAPSTNQLFSIPTTDRRPARWWKRRIRIACWIAGKCIAPEPLEIRQSRHGRCGQAAIKTSPIDASGRAVWPSTRVENRDRIRSRRVNGHRVYESTYVVHSCTCKDSAHV